MCKSYTCLPVPTDPDTRTHVAEGSRTIEMNGLCSHTQCRTHTQQTRYIQTRNIDLLYSLIQTMLFRGWASVEDVGSNLKKTLFRCILFADSSSGFTMWRISISDHIKLCAAIFTMRYIPVSVYIPFCTVVLHNGISLYHTLYCGFAQWHQPIYRRQIVEYKNALRRFHFFFK